MTILRNRQQRTVGDLLKVPLDDRWHTYARVLPEPLVAFYDARTDGDLDPEHVITRAVLFRLWVMNHAITSGRWRRVATLPLERELLEQPVFFKQDAIDPESLSLYRDGQEIPATRVQCAGLERAAVWEPDHVEDRLRDHYLRQANKWTESLRLRE